MEISVELNGVPEALRELTRLTGNGSRAVQSALRRSVLLVQRESIANAPRSPDQKTINAQRKTKVKRDEFGRFLRSRAFSRAKPGGLERSIAIEVRPGEASVFVAANSEAGPYAAFIHDEKNRAWWRRGPGTVVKGARADDKFIERAVKTSAADILTIIKDEIGKAVR